MHLHLFYSRGSKCLSVIECDIIALLTLSFLCGSELCVSHPCSVTGKKLMAKCRGLLQENQELGKQISQGKVTQLEAEITQHKTFNREIKHAQEGLLLLLTCLGLGQILQTWSR